ncbi:putative multidrug resistance ABC transporter ATP-binding/permease protein YheI [Acidibacillus sp. S0AB]|uniref:Multidrug resistance ABC transporter ATP-binding/permease protein YheI n=1 Tax=Sulfoacidibacillus ferrooxidans TaxID=2005001 RepID=A0A9X2ADN7_9BACL|nr:putative multidrug resistance ABC transporter ATP-binding/permease protein YheI [Sulfoacidibacillus ferrooxidans]
MALFHDSFFFISSVAALLLHSFDYTLREDDLLRVFLDLMWYFRSKKWRYISAVATLVVVAVLNLIPPQLVGLVIDSIERKDLTMAHLLLWLGIILAVAVSTYLLRYAWRWLLFGAAIELSTKLREQLFDHFTKMSPQFYQTKRVGDLMAHSTNDISAVEQTAMDGILTLVDSMTTGAVVMITMISTISLKLTIVALLPMPIMAYATSRYGKILHNRFDKAQAAFSDLNDRVQENISGMRVIKAFGQEHVEQENFVSLSKDVVAKNYSVAKIDSLFDPTIQIIVGLSYFLSIAVGGYEVAHGRLTIGSLTTFSMYLGQLIWPMLAFGWLFNIVERGHASYDRIQKLLAIKEDVSDRVDAYAADISGDIDVHINHFTYPMATKESLRSVHFKVKQGYTLGVVGRTGSGKTTLLRLFLREFDVEDGDVSIGMHSIYRVEKSSLRKTIAYVPQDHFLFSATIAENIAFARPMATQSEIAEAARIASIHEDILRFPKGYDTVVGERGVTLSGGQKQRLSIARALLLDAEILILDDSLSAVDARTEAHILDELKDKRQGRTTIISAHRLSAVEHANLIIVLDDGRIAESGTHEDLMKVDGLYATMYRSQQLEDLVEHGGVRA